MTDRRRALIRILLSNLGRVDHPRMKAFISSIDDLTFHDVTTVYRTLFHLLPGETLLLLNQDDDDVRR